MFSRDAQIALGSVFAFMLLLSVINMVARPLDRKRY
mgnify:CR=1 FL=1